MKDVVLYPSFILTAVLGFITGGAFYSQSSYNDALKLCIKNHLNVSSSMTLLTIMKLVEFLILHLNP